MQQLTVFVIDDDQDLRDSTIDLLEDANLNTQGFSNAESFLQAFSQTLKGCILLDVRMDKMNGLTLQHKLNQLGSKLPIIFISAFGDVDTAVTAMKGGAMDFISKPFYAEELLEKVQQALTMNKQTNDPLSSYKEEVDLTARESEIMDLLLKALTSKEIGFKLGISPRTVEVHRQHILQKFKVKSVTQLLSRYNEANL